MTYQEAINFMRKSGTKVAVAMGCEGFYVYIQKSDLIAQLSKLDKESPRGTSIIFHDYEGVPLSNHPYTDDNVLFFDSSVVVPMH